jgi:hypothetical protein
MLSSVFDEVFGHDLPRHVPILGIGPKSGNVNSDVKQFLYYFLPKGQTLTRQNLNPVVRHLHLAFKEMETEERYDVLMEQLVRALNQYDPKYTEKVKLVVEAINHELSKRTQFAAVDVRRYVDFDCDRHIRLLCRRGFLTAHEKTGLEEEGIFSGAQAEVCWRPDHPSLTGEFLRLVRFRRTCRGR